MINYSKDRTKSRKSYITRWVCVVLPFFVICGSVYAVKLQVSPTFVFCGILFLIAIFILISSTILKESLSKHEDEFGWCVRNATTYTIPLALLTGLSIEMSITSFKFILIGAIVYYVLNFLAERLSHKDKMFERKFSPQCVETIRCDYPELIERVHDLEQIDKAKAVAVAIVIRDYLFQLSERVISPTDRNELVNHIIDSKSATPEEVASIKSFHVIGDKPSSEVLRMLSFSSSLLAIYRKARDPYYNLETICPILMER